MAAWMRSRSVIWVGVYMQINEIVFVSAREYITHIIARLNAALKYYKRIFDLQICFCVLIFTNFNVRPYYIKTERDIFLLDK